MMNQSLSSKRENIQKARALAMYYGKSLDALVRAHNAYCIMIWKSKDFLKFYI